MLAYGNLTRWHPVKPSVAWQALLPAVEDPLTPRRYSPSTMTVKDGLPLLLAVLAGGATAISAVLMMLALSMKLQQRGYRLLDIANAGV